MAITYADQGDLLALDAEAIVNPVNCVGVCGRGLALAFRMLYPDNYRAYRTACRAGIIQPGRLLVHETEMFAPRYIVNFPTKRDWRDNSRLDDIGVSLAALATEIERREIQFIALPALGCGLGGLPWVQVKTLIDLHLGASPAASIVVFEPQATTLRSPTRSPGVDGRALNA